MTTTALITGSTSGIGAATAHTLARDGITVAVSGRDETRGSRLVDAITADGGSAVFVAGDLTAGPDAIHAYAGQVTDALGGYVDVLINNAGLYPAPITTELADGDLEAMLAVNIRAPHVLVAALVPGMIARGHGVIINVGSWMARLGNPFAALYSATKAADEQLVRSWASEFGPRGVRVNAVAPGATLTPGNEDAADVVRAMTAKTPAGEPVTPQDIADGIAFLVSDKARMVHGTTLYVDGGITTNFAM